MCKLYLATSKKDSSLNFYNRTINKNKMNKILFLFLFFLTNISFGQLSLQSFEGGIPSSWAINSNITVTNNWQATPSGGYLASGGAFVNPSLNNTIGTTAEYFLISEQFNTPSNGEIRFYTKQGSFTNRGATYQLRVSTASQPDVSSFNVVLQSWTEAQLNVAATTYEEKVVSISSLPSGIPIYIAFVAVTNQTGTTATSGDSWFVDNVRAISSCPAVSNVVVNPGSINAGISWTHPTATNFEVQVVPTGNGIGANGTPVTGTSYTANGLNNNTTYDVYIKAICDASSSSAWVGPTSFTTSVLGFTCDTPIVIPPNISASPYILNANLNDFNNTVNYTSYNSQGLSCQPANTPSTWNWFSGDHAFLSYTPTTSGLVNFSQQIHTSGGGCFANTLSSIFIFDSCAGVGTNASCLGAFTTGNPSSVDYAELNNFYVQAGNTYIILISSAYQPSVGGASVCFTFTVSAPACSTPSGITYQNLQQNSAAFSWENPQNLVTAWEYIAKPVSAGAPNGTDVLTPTSTNLNNLVSGLLPGTQYNFYVRSICSGTPGNWSSPLLFTTQCTVFTPPYYSGFNNGSEIMCWDKLNLNNDAYEFDFGNDANGETVAKLRTSGLSLITNDMLVSPQIHLDGVSQKQLRFKYNIYGNWGPTVNPTPGPGNFEIKLSTTGIGSNNFTTTLVPLTSYTTGYNYIEMIVPIPLNIVGDVNIAWHLPLGSIQTGIQFYIDDVYVENLPACSPPSYPTITPGSITETSVEFSWTNGYNNTQWEVIAVPYGTGTPITSGTLVNTNPYTISGLIHSTKYEFYVRAYCSATEQSVWAGPIVFNTLCGAQNLPYLETFDDTDLTSKKFCWSVNNVDNDLTQWRIETTEASIRAISTMFQPFVSYNDWLISAPINVVGQKVLRYKYRAATSIFYPTARGNFEILMSSSPTFATYTVLKPSEDFLNSDYQEDEIIFTGTGVSYFAFRVPPTMTNPSNSGLMMVDDVSIEDLDLCPNPSGLSASSITTTSANLNWIVGNTETQWEVVIQAPYSGIPTGSGTTVNTNPTYAATSLTSDTNYEYYVRAICASPDVSEWVGPFRFKTKCNVLSTPFLETFDSSSTTESCWEVVNNNGNGNFWNLDQTVSPISGNQMASMFTGTNGNNDDWLITPTLTIQPNQRLRFSYKVKDNFFTEDLKIKLSTNGTDLAQFSTILYENSFSTTTDASGTTAGSNQLTVASASGIQVGDIFYITNFPFPYLTTVTGISGNVLTMSNNATITQPGVYPVTFTHEEINNEEVKEMVINLSNITAPTNTNIAFHIPFFPPNPWAYRGQYLFIDNVIIENIPACSTVINTVESNLTDTSVTLNWEAVGSETSWEISVQPFGTPAPIGNTLPAYLHTTSTHPYTINGLTAATQYQYYVRAICSSSSQSEWVGPFEFTTRCSFTNACQYTITVTNGSTGQVSQHLNLMQNGVVVQEINFPSTGPTQPTSIDYVVYLCNGVEYNLYWQGSGSGIQYSQAQAVIKDVNNNIIWTSPLGLGTINTNIYSGFASCGTVTCPQPTNLTVNDLGVLSWTPGGTETQWEVFIQPLGNGTLPQSGTIVSTPNYTPVDADFTISSNSTYEYFVRAVCSATDKSFWSGPQEFIRNNEAVNSITLPINATNDCAQKGEDVSFLGATPSAEPTSCGGINGGDVWFDFVATSRVHNIELSDFTPGSYYNSSYNGIWPKIIMSLYEVQTDGSLVEKSCSENNSMTTVYSTELIVGTTYKIRLKLNDTTNNDKKFKICISTPTDLCNLDAFNYSFEKLPMQSVTGVVTIINATVVPGWRVNTDAGTMYFQEGSNSPGVIPIDGGQAIQLIHDTASTWNASDPNIKGLYKDFDTSEAIKVDYSFASASRTNGTTLELWAGPISGPFTLVTEHFSNTLVWDIITGTYNVPSGQTTTRFIFRVRNYAIGHLLDAANFKVNTDIITQNLTLNCNQTTTNVVANGIGQWIASTSNPAVTTIATPNSNSTAISGFTNAGDYIYTWKTRYCEKTIKITYLGETTTPTTQNVTLCKNDVALPLTATAPSGYTLMWFANATDLVGTTTAPTPNTSVVGQTNYYVSLVNSIGCVGPKATIVVTIKDLPTATISGATTICSANGTNITFTGTPNAIVTYNIGGGTNTTINLNASGTATLATGNLSATTTYNLVSVASNDTPSCSQNYTSSVIVTVNPTVTPVTSFTLDNVLCSNSSNVLPTLSSGFVTGGTFTSTTGLSINASTGEINVANSSPGNYVVTYSVLANPSACLLQGSSQYSISIIGTIEAEVTASCVNDQLVLQVSPLNSSYNESSVNYTWTNSSNVQIGSNSATFSVNDYLALNPMVSIPFSVNVNVNSQGCIGTASFTVERDPCQFIPRGISPNGDGDNDTFDLTGMGVKEVSIFNRYGVEVYHFSGNYTNQWNGNSDSGEGLPDGTYFYSISKENGQNITGWVYINR